MSYRVILVHIDDTPAMMRRLGAVGITTREACGNSIRNVTACPLAGVCNTETFDVIPYARATAKFMLGHPDAQNFGRKFKIAFSGCRQEACGLVNMHDMGAIAATRVEDGKINRGFELYVGGGLGAVAPCAPGPMLGHRAEKPPVAPGALTKRRVGGAPLRPRVRDALPRRSTRSAHHRCPGGDLRPHEGLRIIKEQCARQRRGLGIAPRDQR